MKRRACSGRSSQSADDMRYTDKKTQKQPKLSTFQLSSAPLSHFRIIVMLLPLPPARHAVHGRAHRRRHGSGSDDGHRPGATDIHCRHAVQAWASQKGFRPKDGSHDQAPTGVAAMRRPTGQAQRAATTRASRTDPGPSLPEEPQHGIDALLPRACIDGEPQRPGDRSVVTHADSTGGRKATLAMIAPDCVNTRPACGLDRKDAHAAAQAPQTTGTRLASARTSMSSKGAAR